VDTNRKAPANAPELPASPGAIKLVEAVLFRGGAPVTVVRAGEVIRGLSGAQFVEMIQTLSREYRRQGRPYEIQQERNGYVVRLSSKFRPIEERLYGLNRQARLSAAAIDVLSLIAYRQPISKHEIEALRGAESGGILRLLVRRALIKMQAPLRSPLEEDRNQEGASKEFLYVTTERFLELFQLGSLDELPRTQDLETM
jgi:segregation and condensation protein B